MSQHDRSSDDKDADARQSRLTNISVKQPDEPRCLYPLAAAAGVERDNYTQAEFDDEICCILREYARRRAPNRRSVDRHLVGVAGELAVATWLDVPFDTRITDDYEGDRGYDLEIPRRDGQNTRVEVKTARRQEPQATVKRTQVDTADWFVLCRASRGADRIDIIGYARRSTVKDFGDQHGLPGYQLTPEYLHVTEGTYLTPDDVREVHHRY